jgi:D-alanyl-lipoteichoic acid acyltransferase DltB (MBOAT superfamily)
MPNSFRVTKVRITNWILGLVGILLLLMGLPLASYSIGYFRPYFTMGLCMIILGFVFLFVLAAFANQKMSLRQTQTCLGFCGQALLGIVAFAIPLAPSVTYPLIPPFTSSPFNLQHYSIFLGILGIFISLISIIMISNSDKK